MALPKNPLDDLSIYTYHLALFMNATNEKLDADMEAFDWETTKTSRASGNDEIESCLLNSVTDAHQLFQELKISQMAPSVSVEFKTSPFGVFSLRISEPGNCMFINKIAKLMIKLKTKAFASAIWGIKIKFVGRTPDNEIVEIKDIDPIYGMLIDIKSNFTQMGSTYDLSFVMASTTGVGQTPEHANSVYIGTMVEPVNLSKVKTLGDGIQKLQEAVQNNYDQYLKIHHPNTQMRKIRYDFSIDPDAGIEGFEIHGGQTDIATDPNCYFSFQQNTPIAHAITTILHRCANILKMLSDSKENWRVPFHLNGKMYQILPGISLDEEEIVVSFKVALYHGSDKDVPEGETVDTEGTSHTYYVFDFYYTDDYNVDVISFDLAANVGLILYLGGTPRLQGDSGAGSKRLYVKGSHGTTEGGGSTTNLNCRVDADIPYEEDEIETKGDIKDVCYPASVNNTFGGATTDYGKERISAIESLAKYASIDAISKTLHIRGHSELLQRCLLKDHTFGATQSMWVKLNIFSRDEEIEGPDNRARYFYDGAYSIISAEHVFNDGKFTQELTLMMMDFEWMKDVVGEE